MSRKAVERLPEHLLKRAILNYEYFWSVNVLPEVIDAARALKLYNVGGRMEFRSPVGTCGTLIRIDHLFLPFAQDTAWNEKVRLSAEASLRELKALPRRWDLHEEARACAKKYPAMFSPGEDPPASAMYFSWDLEDERTYAIRSRILEDRLPPPLLKRAVRSRQGGEHAWPLEVIPGVVEAARALGFYNIGGPLQFRPKGATFEAPWMQVDTFKDVPGNLPWSDKVQRAADVALRELKALPNRWDLLEEGRRWAAIYPALFPRGDESIQSAMYLGWGFMDQEEYNYLKGG